jgi:hypothetical protein
VIVEHPLYFRKQSGPRLEQDPDGAFRSVPSSRSRLGVILNSSKSPKPRNERKPMLTRRAFAGCALCAAMGFLAAAAQAEGTGGLKRTKLKETDGPAPGYATIEMRVEIEPDAPIARHTHPGIESGYLIEGATELTRDGQPQARRRLSGPGRRCA